MVARPVLLSLGWLCLVTCTAAAAPPRAQQRLPKEQLDFFEQKIRPVLVHHCYECHSGDPAKAKAHFVLDKREGLRKGGDSGEVIVPGKPGDSLLIEAIRYESLEMPPKEKLPDETIDDFVRWIEMGAPDPRSGKAANPRTKIGMTEARRFWSFQPPKACPAPQVQDTAWPRSDIDHFVLARLEKEGLKPVTDADRSTLLRRVTFDLTGLPPTPEEIDAFLADESPRAFAVVVDRLLASPRFGERWGRHWLDVARYGESTGKDRNLPYRYAWRYRDYVIDAFNEGKPYNRFIVEQLAGDLLPADDDAQRDQLLIATGFLAIGPKGVNSVKPEQFRMDQADDQIDVTGRAFLGLTIACARCHDHKFDPIPTADYYAMAGILRSTRTHSGIAPDAKHGDDGLLQTLADKSHEPEVAPKAAKEAREREKEIAKVQAQLDELERKRTPGPKRTKQPPGKRGNMASAVLAPSDRKELRHEIKQLEDRLAELESIPSPYSYFVMGVSDEDQPVNCHVLDRDELENKGAEVPRGVLRVLKRDDTAVIPPRQSGRLQMARWIANPDNPMTARVIVNRVWAHLVRRGIVDTVDNFGALGDEPTHPELLDTLAVGFMDDKWSIKRLIRSIVLSRVYQLGGEHDAENYEKDAENKFHWRMERRRLDAEEIRDAMLAASARINLERPQGSEVMSLSNKTIFGPKGIAAMRPMNVRSVYLPIVRGYVPDSLQVFDMADPNLVVGQRDVTNVPTQALYLMNNPFVTRQAEQMARRLLGREKLKQAERVELAFRVALGRPPSPTELAKIVKFIKDYRQSLEEAGLRESAHLAAWASVCQVLFGAGQFRYLY
ncbi:MAG TPA: PSD1 and planctomycete cytochrome C domain-containing protein [Pirellulales bacterium]|nr:PSD1 and planctomycete cytochrome C domain-containing protein [Pirellulales bacterium]